VITFVCLCCFSLEMSIGFYLPRTKLWPGRISCRSIFSCSFSLSLRSFPLNDAIVFFFFFFSSFFSFFFLFFLSPYFDMGRTKRQTSSASAEASTAAGSAPKKQKIDQAEHHHQQQQQQQQQDPRAAARSISILGKVQSLFHSACPARSPTPP